MIKKIGSIWKKEEKERFCKKQTKNFLQVLLFCYNIDIRQNDEK